jgi:predicted GIY-YIG superfamily endonuclease
MVSYVMYRIVCNDLTVKDVYVGSTKNFKVRKSNHKSESMNEKTNHKKVYKMITKHGGWDNWSMLKIEDFECETRLDARKRERYWLEHYNATMNTLTPSRERSEWTADYSRQYRQDNRDVINAQKKIKHDCEVCDGRYSNDNKARHFKSQKHLRATNAAGWADLFAEVAPDTSVMTTP